MLSIIWNKWKVVTEKIGDFETTAIFSIIYFVFFLPIGFIASIFNDYLEIKRFPVWHEIIDNSSSLKKLREQ